MVVLAQLEEQGGDDEAAIPRYRRVLELQPGNVVALNNLAFALAVRHNAAAEALRFAKQAATVAPRSASVLDTLGWIEHLLGNDAEAASLLGQALQLESSQAEIRLHAAIAYAAIGNGDRAEVELKGALRLDPALERRDEVRRLWERIAVLKPTTPK
jgi:Flp pilus assembly protein TadD